jgi:hypothetical protein
VYPDLVPEMVDTPGRSPSALLCYALIAVHFRSDSDGLNADDLDNADRVSTCSNQSALLPIPGRGQRMANQIMLDKIVKHNCPISMIVGRQLVRWITIRSDFNNNLHFMALICRAICMEIRQSRLVTKYSTFEWRHVMRVGAMSLLSAS